MNKVNNNTVKKNNNLGNNITKLNNKIQQNNSYTQKINNTQQVQQSNSSGSSNTIGIILVVIIFIAIIGASYWFYNYYTSLTFASNINIEVLPDIKDATSKTVLASSTIPSSSYSNEYSVSFWVNIQDYNYNYGKEKVIMRRGKEGSGNPEIILDAKKNDLIVRVKLQGQNNSSISNFEDIPIKLPSQNTGMGFVQPENVNIMPMKKKDADMPDMPDMSNMADNNIKIGSNTIDYPTIQYINEMHNIYDNGNDKNSYFGLISGNTISQYNAKLVEGFADVDDAINASIKVIVDICNIAKTIQTQQFADDNVTGMNTAFQSLIDALEKSRTTAKTKDDINKVFSELSTMPTQQSNTALSQHMTTLETDMIALAKYDNVEINYNDFVKAVNAQMTSINCPISISGTSDIDTAISFYENIINLLKKTILTYINNMGSGIQKIYPELNTQTASCLVDNSISKDPTIGTCIAKMIPLQKWVSIIVSVYNQIVDIYIDGQLISSCVLKGFPAISTDELNITPDGGFSGKIARVVCSNTAMTVNNARQIYASGPVSSDGILSMIPNWVYWAILIIIIIALGYSFMM
jgi:hypothetical protein